ncbi:MAG: acyl-CoA thioesterase [Thainema sp.]
MEHYKLVRPEHLNHYGNLFGGKLLQWIDELAYITANLEFPGNQFVTIALDNVKFRQGVRNGEILKFSIICDRIGFTSVKYDVKALGIRQHTQAEAILFETNITFVNIDRDGKKQTINR